MFAKIIEVSKQRLRKQAVVKKLLSVVVGIGNRHRARALAVDGLGLRRVPAGAHPAGVRAGPGLSASTEREREREGGGETLDSPGKRT